MRISRALVRSLRMHHYILTRFSVVGGGKLHEYFGVKSRRNNNMAKFLFDQERMEKKFHVFHNVTLPSIKKQTDTNFTWLIYSSDKLPQEYKDRLLQYRNDKIHIIFVKNFKEMYSDSRKQLEGKKNYSTTRLDDDDGLHPKFLESLNKYDSNPQHIISFPRGQKIKRVKDKYVIKGDVNYKKIATGLSAIDMNIFSTGNHLKVDDKYPVIYDSLKDAYIVFCAPFAKSTRRKC